MSTHNDCRQIQNNFPDYLMGDLGAKTVDSIREHVTACTSCRKELEELTGTWSQLGILPEEQPGPNLRENFYTMLESFHEGIESSPLRKLSKALKIKNAWEKLWPRRPVYQFVFTIAFLCIGFAMGFFIQSGLKENSEMARLHRQNQEINQQLAISLLNQDSPSLRLKGLAWSSRLEKPDDQILKALLHTLNNDANINVRLSAVDALYLFADSPMVKKGLIRSLQNQDSPMVQIALIDLLVQIREKQAVKSLKQLIKKNKLNPQVKQLARSSLEKLL